MKSSHRISNASTPKICSPYAAIVVGIATLLLSAVTLAADPADSESVDRVVADTATPETAGTPATQETEAHATSSAQHADREGGADAKDHKRSAKERRSSATGETASTAALVGTESALVEQKCALTKSTGTRILRMVCISPAQQQANDKYAEQQARDYLRRLSEQGTLAPSRPSPYITSGPF